MRTRGDVSTARATAWKRARGLVGRLAALDCAFDCACDCACACAGVFGFRKLNIRASVAGTKQSQVFVNVSPCRR